MYFRGQLFGDRASRDHVESPSANWRISVETPRAPTMRNYLRGMRLFELMPESVILDVPVLDPLPPGNDQFLPVTPIDLAAGEFGIEELCNFAYPQLPRDMAEEFIEALAEIGSNVVQHAKASEAFASGQRLDVAYRRRPPPRLHLVVGDSGIGIRSSLAIAHPEVEQMPEGEAILKAIEPGVTGRPGVNSGVGLYSILEYVRTVGGEMRIRSGNATAIFGRSGQRMLRTPGLPGTIVSVELCRPGGR
jgi:hypothetical protein